jgi:stress response protein SCP2
VFQVARREKRAPSITSMAETSFATGRTTMAARRLAHAPGLYFRSLDRLLRNADPAAVEVITSLAVEIAPQVSGRVLLGVREHLQNRHGKTGLPRVFANRNSRAWVTPDTRPGIDAGIRRHVMAMLDEVIADRLPQGGRLIIDPDALGVALPLSGKPAAPGLGVMPRGSVSPVVPGEQDVLTFFNYWKQAKHRTDYDLSALMTDREFSVTDWVSWQNYHSADAAATYSGDITSAPDGATEFVTFNLDKMRLPVIVPQILVYSGEEFSEAEESFCGYMLRSGDQRGNPFEPATVRMKSELRGSGRVAMPVAFIRGDDGQWRAKWLHFYLKGHPQFNVVQERKLTTSLLTRAVIERDYLRVGYLTALMGKQTADGIALPARTPEDVARLASDTPEPVTYIGLERPDGLPADATVITLANLTSVIPA